MTRKIEWKPICGDGGSVLIGPFDWIDDSILISRDWEDDWIGVVVDTP